MLLHPAAFSSISSRSQPLLPLLPRNHVTVPFYNPRCPLPQQLLLLSVGHLCHSQAVASHRCRTCSYCRLVLFILCFTVGCCLLPPAPTSTIALPSQSSPPYYRCCCSTLSLRATICSFQPLALLRLRSGFFSRKPPSMIT
ncbi:hypothetical protein BHE74_00053339 [Ensete ventricosum]|nr:hypothetical protein BHE74_00053339 [Ensete ventricosum]RZS27666.1 hypothetical protein BHM03_00061182 [Ensete ventricosum]